LGAGRDLLIRYLGFPKHWCKAAFGAVLDEDEPHLPTIKADVARLRQQVDAL
jgi:hypothetical protein